MLARLQAGAKTLAASIFVHYFGSTNNFNVVVIPIENVKSFLNTPSPFQNLEVYYGDRYSVQIMYTFTEVNLVPL